jgi:hypothetical protein
VSAELVDEEEIDRLRVELPLVRQAAAGGRYVEVHLGRDERLNILATLGIPVEA